MKWVCVMVVLHVRVAMPDRSSSCVPGHRGKAPQSSDGLINATRDQENGVCPSVPAGLAHTTATSHTYLSMQQRGIA
jgi:hypothetical protein